MLFIISVVDVETARWRKKNKKNAFQLYLALVVRSLLPTIYRTVRGQCYENVFLPF
jgi:hypothetical protein